MRYVEQGINKDLEDFIRFLITVFMEINKTLLMGKTAFEMRGNLAQKAP